MPLYGYDIDGVCTAGIVKKFPYVVISGRTFAEYDDLCKKLASESPLYIRGSGPYGDRTQAANFKSMMIRHLNVTEFYEDDQFQADIIRILCPNCNVIIFKP